MNLLFSLTLLFWTITTKLWASTTLMALTLNVAALSPSSLLDEQTAHRIKAICSKLKSSNYDVVFIQEAWTPVFRSMLKQCSFEHVLDLDEKVGLFRKLENDEVEQTKIFTLGHLLDTFLPDSFGYDTGLMILSKYPIQNSSILRFSKNGSEENAFKDGEFPVNKGAIGGTIIHPEIGKIFVATTHLVAEYEDFSYVDLRVEQIHGLHQWLTQNNDNLPTIIGGDFNMSPPGPDGSSRHLNTQTAWNRVRNSLLADYKEAPIDYENLSTYPSTKALSGVDSLDEGVLDHIFGLNGAIPISGGIDFNGTVLCGVIEDTILNCPYSDHLGMMSVFEFNHF